MDKTPRGWGCKDFNDLHVEIYYPILSLEVLNDVFETSDPKYNVKIRTESNQKEKLTITVNGNANVYLIVQKLHSPQPVITLLKEDFTFKNKFTALYVHDDNGNFKTYYKLAEDFKL